MTRFFFHSRKLFIHPKSKYDTWWNFQVKIWEVGKFSIQELSSCKTFNWESHPLWLLPRQIWHNAHSKKCLWKSTNGAKYVNFVEQKRYTWIFECNFFQKLTLFAVFSSKLDTFLILINQNMTLSKVFDSKFYKWWNFKSKFDTL